MTDFGSCMIGHFGSAAASWSSFWLNSYTSGQTASMGEKIAIVWRYHTSEIVFISPIPLTETAAFVSYPSDAMAARSERKLAPFSR